MYVKLVIERDYNFVLAIPLVGVVSGLFIFGNIYSSPRS